MFNDIINWSRSILSHLTFGKTKEYFVDRNNRRRLYLFVLVVACLITTTWIMSTAYYNSQFNVVYSLENRSNNKELIRLIDNANKYVYFAIYFFTKSDIAEALVRAKQRGLEVRGIMDREASLDSNKNTLAMLEGAGIEVLTQKHPEGIMHIKVLVTDKAYASGSYNWTASATTVNDEILEIGTNRSVRLKYLEIIKSLLANNGGEVRGEEKIKANSKKPVAGKYTAVIADGNLPEYDYADAIDHVGEEVVVTGKVLRVFKSKSNTTFLDFCSNYKNCPFSAVIFASDLDKFPDTKQYEREVRIRGEIRSYQGKAEIILEDPSQIE